MNSLWNWFKQVSHNDAFVAVLGHIVQLVFLYILTRVAIRICVGFVNRMMNSKAVKMDERRRNTLTSLLDNVVRYTIYFIFIVESLWSFNIHVETLLAGAGIAGLAVGFGAKNLIQDVLTGFFILFEDQFGVGDSVKINQFSGTVISIGLRLTRIQAWTGEIEIIPNGQIQQVTNYSKSNSIAVVDVGVSYGTDLSRAMSIMEDTMHQLQKENDNILGNINLMGVQSLGQSQQVLRVTAECKPTTNFGVQRMAQQRIREAFDKAGIEIPFPQQVVYLHPNHAKNGAE